MPHQPAPSPHGYAVVTGAASGIGRAIAQALTARGWEVAWVDCDQPGVLSACGGAAHAIVDVAIPQDWAVLRARLQSEWPRLDLLVNAAGVLAGGDVVDTPGEKLLRVLDVNLKGAMLGCRELAPWMIESAARELSPRAGVINLSSLFAAIAPPGFAAYSASKAGLLAFSESFRAELAQHGLNVTAVAPGVVKTALFERSWFAMPAYRTAAARFLKKAQLEPEQVADAALRAASQGKALVVVGSRAKRLWLLKRLWPLLVARTVAARSQRELSEPASADAGPAGSHSLAQPNPPAEPGATS